MKTTHYLILVTVALAVAGITSTHAAEPSCRQQAVDQAKRLLDFHVGGDDRIEIDSSVKALPPIRNPAAPEQRFDVYEVWGHVYKSTYRMHLIYYNNRDTGCVLMGQEVLEFARL